ncbi:MAG: alpha/beta hydrolase [Myxococcota bacterium]
MPLRRPWSPVLRRAFDLGVHRLAWVGYRLHPQGDPEAHNVEFHPDVPYRGTGRRSHLLDVYRPADPVPRPALLYVHGGAFSMLSKDTHRLMALALASRGYVVFNINYRLGPRHIYPKPLEDASAALLWMLEHGAEYGANTSRVAIAGESAGGNLTAALTYIATHPRPEPFARAVFEREVPLRCALPIYGIHDLNDIERFWRHPGKAQKMAGWVKRELEWAGISYVGHPLAQRAPHCPLASPVRLYEEAPPPGSRPLPPFFATVGTADPLLDDSRRLKKAIEARGGACELHVYPGEIHGFNAMIWRPAARAKWRAVFRFLARHLDGAEKGASDAIPLDEEAEKRSDAA